MTSLYTVTRSRRRKSFKLFSTHTAQIQGWGTAALVARVLEAPTDNTVSERSKQRLIQSRLFITYDTEHNSFRRTVIYWWTYELHVLKHNNSRTSERIFIKPGVDVTPLQTDQIRSSSLLTIGNTNEKASKTVRWEETPPPRRCCPWYSVKTT